MQVELLYDMPRIEEKLIIESFRERGLEVLLTNVNVKPLQIGEELSEVAIVRVVSMQKALYSAVARDAAGSHTINSPLTLILCGDKILTLGRLASKGLRVPRSMIAFSPESAEVVYRMLPKPFVDKPPIGGWGRLVTLVKDAATWRSILEHRQMMQSQQLRTHIAQEYVESGGRDIRAIVIGGEFIGAVARRSVGDEWRSNIALGGRAEPIKADGELVEMSVRAAEAVGGEFVSTDILQDLKSGLLYLNEINGVPEFKGFMEATGINVADVVARYVLSVVKR